MSLDVPPCGDIFYVPVENDVLGIGYRHLYENDTFDHDPESRLQGIVFLNDVVYWQEHREEFRRAFLHEIGHRYLARVHVEGSQPEVLLGRDREHWSYFLDTSSLSGVLPGRGGPCRVPSTDV